MITNIIEIELLPADRVVTRPVHQWDIGQIIKVMDAEIEDGTPVDFGNRFMKGGLRAYVIDNQVTIPAPALQQERDLTGYVVITDENSETTVKEIAIPVIARPKPEDYVDEEIRESTEFQYVISAVEAVEANAKAAAEAAGKAADSEAAAGNAATAAASSANSASESATAAAASKQAASTAATTATGKATAAASSATAAASSASAASGSASEAQTAANSASGSATAAEIAAQDASKAATAAETSEKNAAASEAAALAAKETAEAAIVGVDEAITAANEAKASATSAADSATAAGNSAAAADTSKKNAAASETAAGNSATAAGNSATAAGKSATNAAASEQAAKEAASTSTTKATEAAGSAADALNSKNAAGESATKAGKSADEAAEKATAAVELLETTQNEQEEIRRKIDGLATESFVVSKIAELNAQGIQQTPLLAQGNTLDECLAWLKANGDTSKTYIMKEEVSKYVYGYVETTEIAKHTNQLLYATESDGNPYNGGVWHKDGYRLNSSGVETALANSATSGFMKYSPSDGDIQIRIPHTANATSNALHVYDSNFNVILKDASGNTITGSNHQLHYWVELFGASSVVEGSTTKFTIPASSLNIAGIAYIRASTYITTTLDETTWDLAIGESLEDGVETSYKWTSLGHEFVPADYGEDVKSLNDTASDHEIRLKLLEANTDESGVPLYWLTHLEEKAAEIQIAMEAAGWNKSAFLWYTDAHWTNGNSKMSPALLTYLIRNTSMTKTKFGGDIIGDPSTLTHETVKHLYSEWRRRIAELNQDSVLGNHDNLHKRRDDGDIANIVYSFLLAPEEKPNRVMGGDFYYYIDEPCEKTRYLHLDSGRHSLSDDETKFIIEALTSTPDGWHVVVISHIWFQYSAVATPTVGSINTYMQKALDLFDAYNARRSGSVTMVSTALSYNFTSCGGKVEFCIGGHIHVDHDVASTGGIPVIITASDANQERSGDETEDSGTLGTITESAVFGIIADYTNNKVVVVGVGRGTSREITLTV